MTGATALGVIAGRVLGTLRIYPDHLERVGLYAYQQTGLMLTEQNVHLVPDDDVAEFYDVMDRYDALHER